MTATLWTAPLEPGRDTSGDTLLTSAERSGRRPVAKSCEGGLRFAFYGRVPTEDRQDPVTSRERQQNQAGGCRW